MDSIDGPQGLRALQSGKLFIKFPYKRGVLVIKKSV